MQTQTKETQAAMSPDTALDMLKQGNQRFVQSQKVARDHNQQVAETTGGQYPFAVVLSCIDSRVPAEIVFDQGIGDIFSVRVAGNVVNEDVLGSIEYGCKVAGSKVLVVMGHTKCGAVTSACKGVELGNITPLLAKIKPAVQAIEPTGTVTDSDKIEEVAVKNVELSIEQIRRESPILAEMEKSGEIKIVGASYSVASGAVDFF